LRAVALASLLASDPFITIDDDGRRSRPGGPRFSARAGALRAARAVRRAECNSQNKKKFDARHYFFDSASSVVYAGHAGMDGPRRPAGVAAVDDRRGQREQCHDEQYLRQEIEAPRLLGSRLADEARRQGERECSERDVYPEDRTPTDALDEQASRTAAFWQPLRIGLLDLFSNDC